MQREEERASITGSRNRVNMSQAMARGYRANGTLPSQTRSQQTFHGSIGDTGQGHTCG
jgi:hypothetical protein